jgi:hypothetical protein
MGPRSGLQMMFRGGRRYALTTARLKETTIRDADPSTAAGGYATLLPPRRRHAMICAMLNQIAMVRHADHLAASAMKRNDG